MGNQKVMKRFIRWASCLFAFLVVLSTPSYAQQTGTPTPTRITPAPLVSPRVATSPNGPAVGVLAYCTDLTGVSGAQNTVNTLLADGRFSSVTLIDASVSLPTKDYLLSNFKVVIAMTDNRCGIPLPQTIADDAANAIAGFVQGGGGAVIATFGFSTRAATNGIGFGSALFSAGLSPLQQATPGSNAPAGQINIAAASKTPLCSELLNGVTGSVSSTYANYVSLSGGATLCASYTNGIPFLAINGARNVVALNTFPGDQSDNAQVSYQHLISNAVIATVCGPITKGAVTRSVDNRIIITKNKLSTQPSINAIFKPNFGLTLSQAGAACGVTNFDWQQTITSLPSPSPLFQNNNPTPLTAPPPFLDPPLGGYTYCIPLENSPCDGYPFLWNPNTTGMAWSLSNFETTDTLMFYDAPADSELPAGKSMDFTTELVGVLANGQPAKLPEQWTWTDTFNGTSGGIDVTESTLPVDPGSGTGGITITSLNGVSQTPPSVSCSVNPNALWPPNDKWDLVTVSGIITPGTSDLVPGGSSYRVIDEYGQIQTSGTITLGAGGAYAFGVWLIAARKGTDLDGRTYTIVVNARDNVGNVGSCLSVVTVPHDEGNK